MSKLNYPTFVRYTLALVMTITLAISGCGGGGGGSDDGGVSTSSITGSVFASYVSNASCEIQNTTGTVIAGPFMSGAEGVYVTDVPGSELENDLILTCNGGTYIDEVAGGDPVSAGTLSAYVVGGTLSNGDSIHATPGSSIIQQLISTHNMTMTMAQDAYLDGFGYIPDTTVEPTDATDPVDGSSESELLAGIRAAAFSQLTANLGLATTEQFSLLTALALDLSDGSLDGEDESVAITFGAASTTLPAEIKSQFAAALMGFHEGGNDVTGLENNLIFGSTVLTENYKVEFLSDLDAMDGKSQFQIRLTNLEGSLVQSGKSITLMPMMYMESMMHSTPVDGCTEDNDFAGTYNCTLFYIMESEMMDGGSMGYWDLNIMIGGTMVMDNGAMTMEGGEMAHFYPSVMMAMGDTVRATLKNSDDTIANMMGMPAVRPYSLFKSELTGMDDNHTFEIFIAAEESMMSYQAVYENVTLDSGSDMITDLTISTMTVKMSATPDDVDSWVTAESSEDGYWTATGIAGLTNGSEGIIYVQMDINGVQYSNSIGGAVADSDNGYARFTVTPGSSMSM